MGKLLILAEGSSKAESSQRRGRLFEAVMTAVLKRHGYEIGEPSNVNYSGMEIDIDGYHITTSIPLCAECKCYSSAVDSPKLQAFFGKFMTRWLKDSRVHGLFIALPSVNSHAKGFYKENIETNDNVTFQIMEEEEVLAALVAGGQICDSAVCVAQIPSSLGVAGDTTVLVTEFGYFWMANIVRTGSGLVTAAAIFDKSGVPLVDEVTVEKLRNLAADLKFLDIVSIADPQEKKISEFGEEIVEVRGSSECFEYQFPASPEYFVGRTADRADIIDFVDAVRRGSVTARGLLFESSSGWGKSSLMLQTVSDLRDRNDIAFSIDCRAASTVFFGLRAFEYCLKEGGDLGGVLPAQLVDQRLTGFDGAAAHLAQVGEHLAAADRILFVGFDQFENLFSRPDILSRLRDLFLKVCDLGLPIVFGFAWKTDLYGLTTEFPYELRDSIRNGSHRLGLDKFSDVEVAALLQKLSLELHTNIRKDLAFFLSEFSQGYPWLLKKLCAHVKKQRVKGVAQEQMARSLLNVQELFDDDLSELTAQEEDVLRSIASIAPVSVGSMDREFDPAVVRTLVNKRLVVRVGPMYDVYWDIFRDYLNTAKTPVTEHYILRLQPKPVLRAASFLPKSGKVTLKNFAKKLGRSEASTYNVVRELRVLGILEEGGESLKAALPIPTEESDLIEAMRPQVADRLNRNRLAQRIVESLREGPQSLSSIAGVIKTSCPYMSANAKTWELYARIFAEWLDFADSAVFESGVLSAYDKSSELRLRNKLSLKARGRITGMPAIQHAPILEVASRIFNAISSNTPVDICGIRPSTWRKALLSLEDLGFVERQQTRIQVTHAGVNFMKSSGEDKREKFKSAAAKIPAYRHMAAILNETADSPLLQKELGGELMTRMKTDWAEGTGTTNAKIILDWLRYTELVPPSYIRQRRGPTTQAELF